MPGPRSAPNGNWSLTVRSGPDSGNVKTGKTAYKRGEIKHAGKEAEIARVRRAK